MSTFVVARTAKGRPTLMHALYEGSHTLTLCGVSIIGWSRAYFHQPIPQILCKTCAKKGVSAGAND